MSTSQIIPGLGDAGTRQLQRDQFELEPRPKADFSPGTMAALEHAASIPSGFGDRDMTRVK